LVQLAYLLLIVWSLRLVWNQGGIYRVFAIGALLTVLYFWTMTFLVLSILRYMAPATGLLFVLVGGACANRWSSRIFRLPRTNP
ncbi:MAG TPA: hypothetical protein VEW46_10610, partial [Pyrinomonadaceae bacterium]|nr:hypothetical protein [Pyrinomonadaceae bacterium]